MSKRSALLCAVMLLLRSANPVGGQFDRYKAIEAYEIRPGILMMPTYSIDGQVCEVALEARHYSPERIKLDSSLTRQEIDQVFDELAPPIERGARSKGFERDLISEAGNAITTSVDYENVLLQIYGESRSAGKGKIVTGNIVATIRWKNRTCK